MARLKIEVPDKIYFWFNKLCMNFYGKWIFNYVTFYVGKKFTYSWFLTHIIYSFCIFIEVIKIKIWFMTFALFSVPLKIDIHYFPTN